MSYLASVKSAKNIKVKGEMKKMKKVISVALIILMLISLTVTVHSDNGSSNGIIPEDRMMEWIPGVNVGIPGGIPERTTIFVNVATTDNPDYRCYGDGVKDNSAALQRAMNDCPDGQVVYIPAGIYRLNSSIQSYNCNYTIRGDGMGQTILKLYGGTGYRFINIGGGDWPRPTEGIAITSGAVKGSTTIEVGDTSSVHVGKLIRIDPENASFVHNCNSEGDNPTRTFMVKVMSKTDTSVTFFPALPMDLSSLNPKMVPYSSTLTEGVGVEDLTVDAANITNAPLYLSQAWGCWFKGVEVTNSDNRQIWLNAALNSEVRQCLTHNTRSGGPNHQGINLYADCCWNLVEDNICYNGGYPNICIGDWKGGCQGNVIAYNYCDASNSGTNFSGIDINFSHGPHNSLNLVEGNIVNTITSDGYFGSTSHNTVFRNWVKAEPSSPSSASIVRGISIQHYNSYYNIVGNVLGSSKFPVGAFGLYSIDTSGYSPNIRVIYQLGYPYMQNTNYSGRIETNIPPDYTGEPYHDTGSSSFDPNVENTMLRWGNYDYVTKTTRWEESEVPEDVPVPTTHTLPPSLYLDSKPEWWGDELPWPAIGPDLDEMTGKIPAQLRWEAMQDESDEPPVSSLPKPLAEYTFSGNMKDTSENGYHGTTDNPPTLTEDREGNPGSAYHFTGGQYIDLGDYPEFGKDTFTVALWFKHDEVTGISQLIGKANNNYWFNQGEVGYFVGLRDFSGVAKVVMQIRSNEDYRSTEVAIDENEWHFVALIKDTNNISLYVDGIAAFKNTANLGDVSADGYQTRLGLNAAGIAGSQKYSGAIDDVRIYSEALTAEEINELFTMEATAGSTEPDQPEPPLPEPSEIIGFDEEGIRTDESDPGDVNAGRFQAGSTITVNQMKLCLGEAVEGKIKCAIYSDNEGNVGNLLGYTRELVNPGAGWQTFTGLGDVEISAGEYYWLFFWSDANTVVRCMSTEGTSRYWKYVPYGVWSSTMDDYDGFNVLKYSIYAEYAESTVDKEGLDLAIASAETLKEGDYTEESWQVLQGALVAAKAVAANEEASQDDVDIALADLQEAINGLKRIAGAEVPVISIQGPNYVAPGETLTTYVSVNTYGERILAADIVIDYDEDLFEYEDCSETGDLILVGESTDQAGKLRFILAGAGEEAAVKGDVQLLELVFKAKSVRDTGTIAPTSATELAKLVTVDGNTDIEVIVPDFAGKDIAIVSLGDINNDGVVDIKDLGFVALHYYKTTASPDWNFVKIADINGDGKIDIEDLVYVAMRMLQ